MPIADILLCCPFLSVASCPLSVVCLPGVSFDQPKRQLSEQGGVVGLQGKLPLVLNSLPVFL
jgi:hypothetical protein